MSATPVQLAEVYFAAWKAGDIDALRAIFADDVTFKGPLASLRGIDDVAGGLAGLAQITTDLVVHRRLADERDVITWFDLHTSIAPPTPVANWSQVSGGKITAVAVTFDPRAIVAAGPSAAAPPGN